MYTQESKYSPVLYAYPGEIGNKFSVSFNETIEQPTEEVRVGTQLARKIFALADRQGELTEEQHGLGLMLLDSGLLRMHYASNAPVVRDEFRRSYSRRMFHPLSRPCQQRKFRVKGKKAERRAERKRRMLLKEEEDHAQASRQGVGGSSETDALAGASRE
jgi:hypothetical protein